jgi:GntP family gluconate:H+ symporter
MTTQDWTLITLALASVVLLVVLVTRFKVNAFIALALASLLVGTGAVVMKVAAPGGKEPLTMFSVVEIFGTGLGKTLGSIAALIGLGTMFGKLLAESGGANVIAKRFTEIFGPKRVVWCVMALAVVVGLPTWFAVGLVLLLPVLISLTHETKQPFLALAIPLISCMSVMHGLMPPHPGPVAAMSSFRDAALTKGSGLIPPNMGMILVWGFIIGLPTAFIAGPIFARRAVRLVPAEAPPMPVLADRAGITSPSFGLTLFTVLLPILLMLVDTVARIMIPAAAADRSELQTTVLNWASFVGHSTVALLVSVLFASWSFGTRCGYKPAQVLKFTEQSIAAVGLTLLVVGGGGGFAAVLRDAGVAAAMGKLASALGLPVLLYGWLIAAFIRVSTGSATVSIMTSSGLVAPVLAANYPGTNVELLIIAIGCGSLFLSHLNDGGFWIVKECLGLSVSQTLRTWTITETIIGIIGLCITLGVHAVWQALHH